MLSNMPTIQAGKPPPKHVSGKHRDVVEAMRVGEWVVVDHAVARGLCAAARDLGGRATMYRVSMSQTCVKLIEATWIPIVRHRMRGDD